MHDDIICNIMNKIILVESASTAYNYQIIIVINYTQYHIFINKLQQNMVMGKFSVMHFEKQCKFVTLLA